MNYKGTIIEESLKDTGLLRDVKILSTKIERVTKTHVTPWLKIWTLHVVEIGESRVDDFAEKISRSLDYDHKSAWYADFKNQSWHYIVFKNKIFKLNRQDKKGYREAKEYGMSLGIPEYQVDFSPEVN